MSGVITGGWGFVWAAYAITTIGLLIYGISLITRLRQEERR
jgi:heme exporter protein D